MRLLFFGVIFADQWRKRQDLTGGDQITGVPTQGTPNVSQVQGPHRSLGVGHFASERTLGRCSWKIPMPRCAAQSLLLAIPVQARHSAILQYRKPTLTPPGQFTGGWQIGWAQTDARSASSCSSTAFPFGMALQPPSLAAVETRLRKGAGLSLLHGHSAPLWGRETDLRSLWRDFSAVPLPRDPEQGESGWSPKRRQRTPVCHSFTRVSFMLSICKMSR